MRVRIDEKGWLEIKRATSWKPQYCPFAAIEKDADYSPRCGDWCPMFDESINFNGTWDEETKTILHESINGSLVLRCRDVRISEFDIESDLRPRNDWRVGLARKPESEATP